MDSRMWRLIKIPLEVRGISTQSKMPSQSELSEFTIISGGRSFEVQFFSERNEWTRPYFPIWAMNWIENSRSFQFVSTFISCPRKRYLLSDFKSFSEGIYCFTAGYKLKLASSKLHIISFTFRRDNDMIMITFSQENKQKMTQFFNKIQDTLFEIDLPPPPPIYFDREIESSLENNIFK